MLAHAGCLLPRPYLDGIGYLAAHDTIPAPGYLAGIAYTGGRWWFWPLSLVIKIPATVLALLVTGAGCWAPGRVSGWVAVSATALNSVDRSQLAWLRRYCPVSVLSGSILIYRFPPPPAAAGSPRPVAEGARPGQGCARHSSRRIA